MISKEEVKKIAKLARLGITDKEVLKYQKDLSSILDYFEKLKEVDVSGAGFEHNSFWVENVTRRDVASAKQKAQSAKLTELMPETEQGYLKVNPVLSK